MNPITFSSPIWSETADMSRKHQYKHDDVALFLSEAKALLERIYDIYERSQLRFDRDERTLKKAMWMLDIECVVTLTDAVDLLHEKRHRVAGKMLRQALEAVDISSLFCAEGEHGVNLGKWYDNEIVSHKSYRNHIKKQGESEKLDERREWYRLLSKWTHHTYYALCNSYVVGKDDKLAHDAHKVNGRPTKCLITPETIYQHCWLLSVVILLALHELEAHGFITGDARIPQHPPSVRESC